MIRAISRAGRSSANRRRSRSRSRGGNASSAFDSARSRSDRASTSSGAMQGGGQECGVYVIHQIDQPSPARTLLSGLILAGTFPGSAVALPVMVEAQPPCDYDEPKI